MNSPHVITNLLTKLSLAPGLRTDKPKETKSHLKDRKRIKWLAPVPSTNKTTLTLHDMFGRSRDGCETAGSILPPHQITCAIFPGSCTKANVLDYKQKASKFFSCSFPYQQSMPTYGGHLRLKNSTTVEHC